MKVGLIQFGPAFQPGSISSVFFLRVLRLSVVPFFFGLAWAECRLILVGGFTTEYTEGTEEIQKKDAQFRSLYAWLRCSRASLFEAMKVGLIQFGPAVQPGSISSVFFLRVLGVLCGAFLLGPGLRGDGYCFGGRYPSPGICKLR